ncbi:MAG: ATP synthase subunit I [Nitrospinota bacterium]
MSDRKESEGGIFLQDSALILKINYILLGVIITLCLIFYPRVDMIVSLGVGMIIAILNFQAIKLSLSSWAENKELPNKAFLSLYVSFLVRLMIAAILIGLLLIFKLINFVALIVGLFTIPLSLFTYGLIKIYIMIASN